MADWNVGAGSTYGNKVKQTGRDRSGRVPRASNHEMFWQDIMGLGENTRTPTNSPYDPDGAAQEFPNPPSAMAVRHIAPASERNMTLNATADYHNDPLAHGGANSDSS